MSHRTNCNQRIQHSQSHTNSQSISSPSHSDIQMNTPSRYLRTSSPLSTTLPHPFTLSMPMSSHPNIQFKDDAISHSLFHDESTIDTFTLDPTNKSLQALTSLLYLRTSSPSLESIIPTDDASTSSTSSTSESSPISSPITYTRHHHCSPSRSLSCSVPRSTSRASSPHSDLGGTGIGIIARVIAPPPDSTTTKRHAIKKYGTVVNAMQLDVSQVFALQRKVESLRKKRKHVPGSGNYQRKCPHEQHEDEEDVLDAEPGIKQLETPFKRQRVLSTSSVSKSSSSSSLSSLLHSLPPTPPRAPTDDIHPFRQLISRLKRRHLLAYHRLAADAAQQHLKSITSDDTHITITPTTPSPHQHMGISPMNSSHPHMGISPTPVLHMGSTSPIPLPGSHGSAFAGIKSHIISPTPVSTPSTPGFSSFPSAFPPFSYPTSSTSRPFPMPFPDKRTSGSSTSSSGSSPFSLSSFNMSLVPVAVM